MQPQTVHIVQLPFPSLRTPHERIIDYYRDYSRLFSQFIDRYFIPEGSLWELPLWVAHLAGMLESLDYCPTFIDLSVSASTSDECARKLLAQTRPGEIILMSPLAQNFDLAVVVSRRLMRERRVTILGGNMSPFAKAGDATVIHHGQASPSSLAASLVGHNASVTNGLARGEEATWFPNYRLLEAYRDKVPLLRLNASHGCLYACDFCGDAWSRRLVLVPPAVLEDEIQQFEQFFPDTRLIYIGDKTFGQSKKAVKNLLEVFARRPQYHFIVQTHVLAIDNDLIDAMEQLGVKVVEMGFESASTELLRNNHKPNLTLGVYADRVACLANHGMRVILNILGGLPSETREAHKQTLEFINNARSEAWLYNLYNFVPYPLTPQFATLRSRIIDWDYSHWREDSPPVFQPYHMTSEESFELFLEKVTAAHNAIRSWTPHFCDVGTRVPATADLIRSVRSL